MSEVLFLLLPISRASEDGAYLEVGQPSAHIGAEPTIVAAAGCYRRRGKALVPVTIVEKRDCPTQIGLTCMCRIRVGLVGIEYTVHREDLLADAQVPAAWKRGE